MSRKTGQLVRPGIGLKREYFEWTKLAAIAAGVYEKGLTGPLTLTIRWYYPNNRTLDIDNGEKTLQDALAKAIGFNDRQICETHKYRMVEKGVKPHCEIELRELEYE